MGRVPGSTGRLQWEDGGGCHWGPTLPTLQVLPTDELVEPKKSHRQSHRKKVLPEIYLTRLLSTKVGPVSMSRGLKGSPVLQGEVCVLPATQ